MANGTAGSGGTGSAGSGGMGPGFGGVGMSSGMDSASDDAKILTDAIGKQTQAYRENTATQEAYGRLSKKNRKEHERMRDVLLEDAEAAKKFGKQLFTLRGQYDDAKSSVKSYAHQLMALGSISNVYAAKLKYMREGQEAFTKSLVATTGDANRAMAKSQQYVNAVHAAYANVHSVAREFNMDSEAIKKSVGELSSRFATQIAASNDMAGSMKSMQREAVVMGRYLGVDMTQVMDAWNDRMQQSNMTLEESRKEFIAVTYTTDKYAKEIAALGDRFLKTGNIGKNEFLKMVQDIGKEMRTGTYDAAAYAGALKNLLVAGKKQLLTTNEQRVAAEGLGKITQDMFTWESDLSIFGVKAAESMMSKWHDLSFVEDAMVKKRIEMVRDDPTLMHLDKIQSLMATMKGTAAGTAMGLGEIKGSTITPLQRQLFKTRTGGDPITANLLAKQVSNGEAIAAFNEKAKADAEKGREEQVDVWKKGIEDMVKAGATPKDLDYKMIAELEKANQWLKEMATKFPYWLMGAQLGGSVLKSVGSMIWKSVAAKGAATALTTGASTAAATGGGAAVTAAGGAAPTAAGGMGVGAKILAGASRIAPLVGKAGILGATFALSYYGSKALDKYAVKIAESSGDAIKGTYDTYSDYLTSRIVYGKETAAVMDRMTYEEKDKRFKLLKLQQEEIDALEKYKNILSETNKEKLKQLKREKAANEKALGARIHRRAAESTAVEYEASKELNDILEERVKVMGTKGAIPTNSKKFVEEMMFGNLGKDRSLKMSELMSGNTPAAITAMIDRLPEELKKTLNKKEIYEEAVKAVQMHTAARSAASLPAGMQGDAEATAKASREAAEVGTWSKEKLAAYWSRNREGGFAAMPDATQLENMRKVEAATKDINIMFSQNSDIGSSEVGSALPASLNARGELRIPQQPIVLNVTAFNDSAAKQKTRDTHD